MLKLFLKKSCIFKNFCHQILFNNCNKTLNNMTIFEIKKKNPKKQLLWLNMLIRVLSQVYNQFFVRQPSKTYVPRKIQIIY